MTIHNRNYSNREPLHPRHFVEHYTWDCPECHLPVISAVGTEAKCSYCAWQKEQNPEQLAICNDMVAEISPTLEAIRAALQIAEVEQESQPYLERRREPVYLGRKINTFDEQVLAHIDELVGPERLPIGDMLDASELFPRNYNNQHVPGGVCPKCGAGLIVKERRLRQRGGEDYVTNFVGCAEFERTGCRHTEPITDEIKAAIDAQVTADVDLGI